MTVLLYYRVQGGAHVNEVFQAVLIAQESIANRGKRTENKLWKRVVSSETEFAWLPPNIAWAFCSDALPRRFYRSLIKQQKGIKRQWLFYWLA